MIALYITLWYLSGFLISSVCLWNFKKSYVVGDLLMSLFLGVLGPINISVFLISWMVDNADKRLF